MTSTTNKFHSYTNVGFDDQTPIVTNSCTSSTQQQNNINATRTPVTNSSSNGGSLMLTSIVNGSTGLSVNKTAIESPFQTPIINGKSTAEE